MEDLQKNLEEETIIVEEKKQATQVKAEPLQGASQRTHPAVDFSHHCPAKLTNFDVQALIESIGQEKAKVDEEVEKGREDEEAAAALQAEVTAFQGKSPDVYVFALV